MQYIDIQISACCTYRQVIAAKIQQELPIVFLANYFLLQYEQ